MHDDDDEFVVIIDNEDEHEERAAEFGERLLDAIQATDPDVLSASIDANILGLLLNGLGGMLHSAMISYQLGDHENAWKSVLAMAPAIVRESTRRIEERTAKAKAESERLAAQLQEMKKDD